MIYTFNHFILWLVVLFAHNDKDKGPEGMSTRMEPALEWSVV